MTVSGYIDVHRHILPSDYVNALDRIGQSCSDGSALPTWTKESALAMLDQQGIATAIVAASERNIPIILDLSPADRVDPSLFPKVTYLVPDAGEAEKLTGIQIDSADHAIQAARSFLEQGVKHPIAFIGVTSTLGLLALQVPLPFVNGLLAGLSAFIPYLGAIASVVPPMLLALLDEPWKAAAVLLSYFVIHPTRIIRPLDVLVAVANRVGITAHFLSTIASVATMNWLHR
jgi:hypothetical protein